MFRREAALSKSSTVSIILSEATYRALRLPIDTIYDRPSLDIEIPRDFSNFGANLID
jgi:hypothetical protein